MNGFDRLVLRHSVRLALALGVNDWSSGPRPADTAQVYAAGVDPLRVLLFGGGPAVGYGVKTHELALAGALARRLSAVTGRAVDVDVRVRADLTVNRAKDLVATVSSEPYDVVVVVVGVTDALGFTSLGRWRSGLTELFRLLRDALPTSPIAFIAVPPASRVTTLGAPLARLVDEQVAALNSVARAVVAETPSAAFVPFLPDRWEDGTRHRSPEVYDRWAAGIVRGIADRCAADPATAAAHEFAGRDVDEAARQRALERLDILDTGVDESFNRIVRLAKDLFGVPGAAISFIDDDRQWFKARVGVAAVETARTDAFCDFTIRQTGALVVTDASLDGRFRSHRFVLTRGHVRFYAGYPIESPDGQRIGALCVFDSVPRAFSPTDETLLRNLAHLVQDELGARAHNSSADPVGAGG